VLHPRLAAPHNSKLGGLIHSWSLPSVATCPGASALCRMKCYTTRGHFCHHSIQKAYQRNYDFSRTADFVPWMQGALMASFVRVMRVHVSGDFYDPVYVRKWVSIARASRHITFFAYTRSWRADEMLPELIRFSRLPNVHLWWSTDRETGPAPAIRGIRTAYMAVNDIDGAHAPNHADLVFRDLPPWGPTPTAMKRANGVLVCPAENGVKGKTKHTCSTCKLCWTARQPKWETAMATTYNLSLTATELRAPIPIAV